ncbi:MAG: phage terminase small subunit-related protein [Bacteroidetes bacterium]|nr:phage terminase small subunit-related protein [Bacteroidota bacterium]
MGKFTKIEGEKKRQYGKSLYVKGFDIPTISDIIGAAESTVRKWRDNDKWEDARNSAFIALSELRNTILQSFIDLKDGKKPKIKPDEAAKYASAFERLSDRKKTLSYMYEAFEMLTHALTKDIEGAANKKDKELSLEILKRVRTKTDTIITKLTNETLND